MIKIRLVWIHFIEIICVAWATLYVFGSIKDVHEILGQNTMIHCDMKQKMSIIMILLELEFQEIFQCFGCVIICAMLLTGCVPLICDLDLFSIH